RHPDRGGPLADLRRLREVRGRRGLRAGGLDGEAGHRRDCGPRRLSAACAGFAAGEDCVREISMVKLYTAEMVNRVAYDCVQLHGGYGYMREYAIERFARDARLMTIGGGTSEIMRDIIAKAVLSCASRAQCMR